MAADTLTRESPPISTDEPEVKTWHGVLSDFHRAKAAAAQFDADHYDPLYRAFRTRWPNWPIGGEVERTAADEWSKAHRYNEITSEYERLSEVEVELESDLMKRPAPDAAALLWKLDKIFEFDSEGYSVSWSEGFLKQTIADYRRLLGDA